MWSKEDFITKDVCTICHSEKFKNELEQVKGNTVCRNLDSCGTTVRENLPDNR